MGALSQRMSKPNGALQVEAPCVVTDRTWAYSEYPALPVIHGSVRLTEKAGILIGAIEKLTALGGTASARCAFGSGAVVKLTVTARQCFPAFASVETFD